MLKDQINRLTQDLKSERAAHADETRAKEKLEVKLQDQEDENNKLQDQISSNAIAKT